jgi:hypothetical protein
MRTKLSNTEAVLMTACAGLLALAVFGPWLDQPLNAHAFADQRVLLRIPNALDVLSNLPFALAGLLGLYCLWSLPPRSIGNMQRAMAVLFFAGLLFTAAGSSWYHAQPDNFGLVIDRSGMAVAFAGALGLAAAGRVSSRAGAALGLLVLLLAPFAIDASATTGNLLPWAVLQFGGAALLLWLALLRPRYWALDIRWGLAIMAYAAAKVLEMNDAEVFRWTEELVSGHTLKHVVAALAALPVIAALYTLRSSRQNAPGRIVSRSRARHATEA